MYSKVVVFICFVSIASGGQVYQQEGASYGSYGSYGSYALPAATSHQRINIDTSSERLITRKYAAPVVYEAAPVAYVAPVVAQQRISKPAVSSQSIRLLSYNPTPIVSRTYAPAVATYSAPSVETYSAPVSYTVASPVKYTAAAPVAYAAVAPVAYADAATNAGYSSYVSSQSASPAVSHVSYNGLGASYKW